MATATKTKTVPLTPPRPKRKTKAQKILSLKRSAAAKSRHHRKHLHKHARIHTVVFALLVVIIMALVAEVSAVMADLVPPPSPPINMEHYRKQAEIARKAQLANALHASKDGSGLAADPNTAPNQTGIASWYALGLRAPDALTCASRDFPRGSYLEVTNLRNGKKVTCLVNDYGPQAGTKRVIDLSRGSFRQLEGLGSGTLPAEIRVVSKPN